MNERIRTTLIAIGVLVAVALIPAVLLYYLFGELSSAQWAPDETVKLGGPVAAFVIILVLLSRFYGRWAGESAADKEIVRQFTGDWRVIAKSDKSGREAHSRVTAAVDAEGHLRFGGNFLDTNDKPVGDWRTLNVFCTRDGLAFRYTLTDSVGETVTTWIGFSALYVMERDKYRRPSRLSGRWDVIGPNHHYGTIEFTRPAQQ